MAEEVKWKKPSRPQGVSVWSDKGIVCIGEMLKEAVRLTFPNGARLKDPDRLFNARLASNTVRAIDIGEGDKVNEASLRTLVVQAAFLNADAPQPPAASKRKLQTAVAADKDPAEHLTAHMAGDGKALRLDDGTGPAGSRLVPGGVVHEMPLDLHEALVANQTALTAWMDITPLARNEFICWVQDAKQEATRQRRIRRTQEELEEGLRRPCCWPGCKHRERNRTSFVTTSVPPPSEGGSPGPGQ